MRVFAGGLKTRALDSVPGFRGLVVGENGEAGEDDRKEILLDPASPMGPRQSFAAEEQLVPGWRSDPHLSPLLFQPLYKLRVWKQANGFRDDVGVEQEQQTHQEKSRPGEGLGSLSS